MPTENKADMFMRLLFDAFEADRILRHDSLKVQNRSRARRFTQRCRSDINAVMDRMGPQDCVQLMDTQTQDRQVN